ncbi:hypothetical protein DL770_007393 [Monosporascus sp. CRB-9-2]|nr:hypothetical protein DL770_007393 [Monosporascus sp. CRB-9-2]
MGLLLRAFDKGSLFDVALTIRKIAEANRDVSCIKCTTSTTAAGAERGRLLTAHELDRRAITRAIRDWRRQFETTMTILTLADRIEHTALDVPDDAGAVGVEWEDEQDEQDID